MLLTDKQIIEKYRIRPSDKVLDIGGSMRQRENINVHTLVDIVRPEEAPYGKSKLRAKNFVRLDITKEKLPFRDKEFDFSICSHTLEDLTTPFLVLDEMARVAKRGLIITPSMGADLVFSHIDITDWLTGARRVPGIAHHKWFFHEKRDKLRVVAKNYPILYTPQFHFISWSGEDEFSFYWENKIDYEVLDDSYPHKLIDEYTLFYERNKKRLRRGLVLVFIDNPYFYIKEFIKLLLKKGEGFRYRRHFLR